MTIKTYMEDSYLKEIKANVISITNKEDLFYIILDRTIFYPHLAGGQPRDKGTINGINVIDVYEDEDNNIIHVVKEEIHSDKVDLNIDWNNRFDLMQQHTGQHLLSANIFNLYQAETESFHFGDEYISIEVTKDDFSDKEIKQVEYLTNRMIQSNIKISSYLPSKEDLTEIPLRKTPTTDEELRVVEIDGIDFSACCGTHLNSTGELGLVKIRKTEKTKGKTKIDFVCGYRALQDYSWKNDAIYEVGALLSAKAENIVEKTKELIEIKENLEKELLINKKNLAKARAKILLSESKSYNNISYIVKSFDNENIKDVNLISSILNESDNTIQLYTTNNNGIIQFVISRSNNLDIDLNYILKGLKDNMNIRGGGSQYTVQGTIDYEESESLIREFYSKIREYYKEKNEQL